MADRVTIESYQSYRDLPSLAGLATIAEAARPGLGIEACVARLKRSHTPSCGSTKFSRPGSPPSPFMS